MKPTLAELGVLLQDILRLIRIYDPKKKCAEGIDTHIILTEKEK